MPIYKPTDSPRSRRNTTSRLRATLQRWPAANGPIVDGFDIVPGKPVEAWTPKFELPPVSLDSYLSERRPG